MSGIAGAILDGVAQGALKHEQSPNPSSSGDRLNRLIVERVLSPQAACSLVRDTRVTLPDFLDPAVLLSRLDPTTLGKVADVFGVRYDWLCGRDSKPIQSIRAWENNHLGMAKRLLRAANASHEVELVVFTEAGIDIQTAEENGECGNSHQMLPVLIRRSDIDGKESFASYEAWEPCRWNFWRERADLKLAIYFASLLEDGKPGNPRIAFAGRFRLTGRYLPKDALDRLIANQILPATAMRLSGQNVWHPSELVLPGSHVHKGREDWARIVGGAHHGPRIVELDELYAEAAAAPVHTIANSPKY